MEQTIESRVAATVLERPTGMFEINGHKYQLAPPTIATLILVSEIVSTLPIVEKTEDPEARIYSALHHAKNYKALGDLAAVLILGAKAINEQERQASKPKRWYSRFLPKRRKESDRQALARSILENTSPSDLFDIIIKRLKENEVGFFFLITTSLSEANLLKPTKEAKVQMTQFGQPSSASQRLSE